MIDSFFSSLPFGLRNNNWLGIRCFSGHFFKGQIGKDNDYCIFSDPLFCFCAARNRLRWYLRRFPSMNLFELLSFWKINYLGIDFICSHVRLNQVQSVATMSQFQFLDLFYWMSVWHVGVPYIDKIDYNVITRGFYLK